MATSTSGEAVRTCPLCGEFHGPRASIEAHISGKTDGPHQGKVGQDFRDEITDGELVYVDDDSDDAGDDAHDDTQPEIEDKDRANPPALGEAESDIQAVVEETTNKSKETGEVTAIKEQDDGDDAGDADDRRAREDHGDDDGEDYTADWTEDSRAKQAKADAKPDPKPDAKPSESEESSGLAPLPPISTDVFVGGLIVVGVLAVLWVVIQRNRKKNNQQQTDEEENHQQSQQGPTYRSPTGGSA